MNNNGVNTSDPDLYFSATQGARKILSQEKNPPPKLIVEAGLIPRLVEFLKTSPLFVARGSLGSDPFCFRDLGADPSQPLGKGGGIQPLTELLPSSRNCV